MDYKRALTALTNGDKQMADNYFRRVKSYMIAAGFRPDQYSSVYSQAATYSGNLVDKIKFDFWKNAPADQQADRFKQLTNRN
jgi:hypothetical protein